MRLTTPSVLAGALAGLSLTLLCFTFPAGPLQAGPKAATYWNVEDVRAGMKGEGKTVLKGTKLETFQVEILGVLKNSSPGRDLVLARLSGADLEKTGVIAGMSGSPVYIDGKLLGAVAYAWPYSKEPIAGITPFSQMHGYVESYERRDIAQERGTRQVGLASPVTLNGKQFESAKVSLDFSGPEPTSADGLWMTPIRTPVAATGFSAASLALLREQLGGFGMLPMQGGAATAKLKDDEKNIPLQAGGALAVSLIRGDFDLSGIGTVTHIEGNRVYGWGHPFMTLGACEMPLMTGHIHTVNARQSISFKMGSPIQDVGVINADVSTCIAGWLGKKCDMLPVRMTINREPSGTIKTFNVEMVRQRNLLSGLLMTALTNAVDMEGDMPDEMTADMEVKIEVEGFDPILFKDTYSGPGFSGVRAPQALFSQVTSVVGLLTSNPYKPIRLTRVEVTTHIHPGRRSADIEAIELDSDTYAPGETVKGTLYVRPYRGERTKLPLALKLPNDLPEGSYSAVVCDDLTNARAELRDNPQLGNPQTVQAIFDALKVQTSARRTNLVVRVPLKNVGVAVDGKALPNLPPSMVHILGNTRKGGAQATGGALIARQETPWVFQGLESIRFTVSKNKKALSRD